MGHKDDISRVVSDLNFYFIDKVMILHLNIIIVFHAKSQEISCFMK